MSFYSPGKRDLEINLNTGSWTKFSKLDRPFPYRKARSHVSVGVLVARKRQAVVLRQSAPCSLRKFDIFRCRCPESNVAIQQAHLIQK
jgi:hypothetical protein